MPLTFASLIKELVPPVVVRGARRMRSRHQSAADTTHDLGGQPKMGEDRSIFCNRDLADLLEHWAEGNAWNEIQYLMAGRTGRVLDIGCGPGTGIAILQRFSALEVYGCDLSDMLIKRAIERGIRESHLTAADATALPYADGSFEWGFTLGVLHYLTDENIGKVLRECRRVVSGTTFHQIPVERHGNDMGWIKTFQSVQNNSLDWWKARFGSVYARVDILDSSWADHVSVGKWVICQKA
jgi:SAM-dependent methyltransferase